MRPTATNTSTRFLSGKTKAYHGGGSNTVHRSLISDFSFWWPGISEFPKSTQDSVGKEGFQTIWWY